MLKIAAEGIAPRLAACCLITSSAQSSCQRVAPQAARATQKYLSQSQMRYKKLVIKDHYEFDQKVRSKFIHDFHTHMQHKQMQLVAKHYAMRLACQLAFVVESLAYVSGSGRTP